jgi:hypothetical protein
VKKLDKTELLNNVADIGRKLNRYKVVIVIVLIAAVYGFLVWRIESLNNIQPSQDAITAQANPLGSAHIDKQTVNQLESLRDNSVNVQTLFVQARDNPFQ